MGKRKKYKRLFVKFREVRPQGCIVGVLLGIFMLGALLYATSPVWMGLFDPTPVIPARKRNFSGIDVSKHQGRIDWKTVAEDERVQFAYIKATEGASLVDRRYATNIRQAREAGIMVGSYHFFLARKSAQEQFDNFSRVVDADQQDLLPMVDIEESGCIGYTRATIQQNLGEFMELVKERYGKYPLLYSQYRFYNDMLAPEFNRYYLFIARYGPRPPAVRGGHHNIWQFAEDGHVRGINGTVDLDIFANGTRLGDIRL